MVDVAKRLHMTSKAAFTSSADPAKSLAAAPKLGQRVLNVLPDATDLRDRIYEPALLDLALSIDAPDAVLSPVRDQGREGACTGFALSSAITLMNRLRHRKIKPAALPPTASPRMLYEMAKLNDEWPGEDYEGSSIRGALKGFYNNGACSDDVAPFKDGEKNWFLKVEHAKDARSTGLGAYYRLRPEIIDYHAALNETGVIYVSAYVHRGWQNPSKGIIKPSHLNEGGHAFVIVGYDDKGFLIQNSWGEDWGGFKGQPGIAHWSYADWAATVMDAWVLRLSVPHPRLAERRFVLQPLADLAPDRVVPRWNETVADLLAACPDRAALRCTDFALRDDEPQDASHGGGSHGGGSHGGGSHGGGDEEPRRNRSEG